MCSMIDINNEKNLKKYCTFKIGGNAKYLFICFNKASLINVCEYCKIHNIKYKVIGLGANLLFDDAGFDGAIIVNKSNKILIKNNSVYAESGISVGQLINTCANKNLGGLENLSGIPSTLGGAIFNNLGAFGSEICEFVEYVEVFDKNSIGKLIKLKKDDCKFSYRNSIFKEDNYIITKAKLNLIPNEASLIKKLISATIKKKAESQPLNYPSAGSVFKRSNLIPAKVIDELGLKGTRIGDAEISTKHAGFIVNLGNATSKDVKDLINLIQNKVFSHYGEMLETEIEFV